MGVNVNQDGGDLWIEWYARRTGLEYVADRVPGAHWPRPLGPYLFIIAVWLFDALVLSTLPYLGSGALPIREDLALFLVLPGWLFATYLILAMRRRYASVVEELEPSSGHRDQGGPARRYERLLGLLGVPDPRSDPKEAFDQLVPTRLRVALLVSGFLVYVGWLTFDPSPLGPLPELYGPVVARIKIMVLLPLVYYVIAVELASLYLGLHVLLPLKLTSAGHADLTEPDGYLGFRPVGTFVRDSTLSLLVAMTAFVLFETVAFETSPFDPVSSVLLLGSSLFALGAFFGPVYWLHVYMRDFKADLLDAMLDEENPLTELMNDVLPGERVNGPLADTDEGDYLYRYIQLERVEKFKEFPVESHLVAEFLFVLLLPYLAHLSSIYVFELLLH